MKFLLVQHVESKFFQIQDMQLSKQLWNCDSLCIDRGIYSEYIEFTGKTRKGNNPNDRLEKKKKKKWI